MSVRDLPRDLPRLQTPGDHAEAARLAALHGYDLLDAPADPELDAVVRIAAALAGVPTATVNLVDAQRQCQVSAVGSTGGTGAGDVVVTRDARRDPRFRDSASVDGRLGEVVFHACVPLVTAEGHHLGSLCVVDDTPRDLTPDQVDRLRDLAGVVVALLEKRHRHREQRSLVAEVQEQRQLLEITLGELSSRDAFTQTLLDSLDVGVVACDAQGRLTVLNPAARRMHGLDPSTGPDATLPAGAHARAYDLFAADGSTPLTAADVPLHRALAGQDVHGAEIVVAPTGREPVRVACTGRALVDDDGRVLGAVVAMQDVTADRARLRALEVAGERLRRSNEELSNLAAVASHDLAAPLTAVIGYLDLVLDVHREDLGPQGSAWIGTALRAAHRMQGLIEAVLEHARSDAGGFTPRPVVVRDVLSHVVEDLGSACAPARIGYTETPAEPGGRVDVRADPVLLRQLLQNLVGNAVRHRDPDRPCRVDVGVTALPCGGWELTVADNGRGIPEQQREQVFAMFATGTGRVGPPTGEPGEQRAGHGIGLATCRRIVVRHGGRIRAEQTPGGGATLRATFPRASQPTP